MGASERRRYRTIRKLQRAGFTPEECRRAVRDILVPVAQRERWSEQTFAFVLVEWHRIISAVYFDRKG